MHERSNINEDAFTQRHFCTKILLHDANFARRVNFAQVKSFIFLL